MAVTAPSFYTASTVTPTAALAIADEWAAARVLADAATNLLLHAYRRPGPATTQAHLVSSLMAHLAKRLIAAARIM